MGLLDFLRDRCPHRRKCRYYTPGGNCDGDYSWCGVYKQPDRLRGDAKP